MGKTIRNWISSHLNFSTRLEDVGCSYIASLMLPTDRHSYVNAAELSELDASQFSRFNAKNASYSAYKLENLSKDAVNQIRGSQNSSNVLLKGTPWRVAIIIDSSIHNRSTLHTENAQRFNHGGGFKVGHQWTNIILAVGDSITPLPPIAFHSKNYCKKNGLNYTTEHEKIANFLGNLDLSEWIGSHNSKEIVVMMDSGYDNKRIQTIIGLQGWDFLSALKCNRGVQADGRIREQFPDRWYSVDELFCTAKRQSPWRTVYDKTEGKRKRTRFRARLLKGYLKGVKNPVSLVCSKKLNGEEKRYFACSNTKVNLSAIVKAYRKRWSVEIFHREVKDHLGLQDVGASKFDAVASHVHWVYCAFILLYRMKASPGTGIRGRQRILQRNHEAEELNKVIQETTQIKGAEKIRRRYQERREKLALKMDEVG
jgi:hypothetical protein